MPFKAIGFDYGGVLNGEPGGLFTARAAELVGVDINTYRSAYFAHNKKVNMGQVTWRELWTLVLTDLGKIDKLDALESLAEAAHTPSLNHEVLTFVDQLRSSGYKTGLLSNNTRAKGEYMRSIGLDKHFDVFHISAETGMVKPGPATFDYFAKCLEVSMEELAFIDDAPHSLSTAQTCGYTPILFESYDQLQRDLMDLGLLNN